MKTVVAFTNNKVQIFSGEGSDSKIAVSSVIDVEFETNCVINGVITDPDVFTAGMLKVWAAKSLPKRDIILSLDGNNIKSRKISIPNVDNKKTQEIVSREFDEIESTTDPLFSYIPLSLQGTTREIVAICAEHEFISHIILAFSAIGIKVSQIVSSRSAIIALLKYIDIVKAKNCIIQSIDGETLTTILLENGEFVNISTARVFSEHGTNAFGTEVARNISQLLQFQSSQRSQNVVGEIYMAGFSESDYTAAKSQIELLSLTVNQFSLGSRFTVSAEMSGTVFLHAGAFTMSKSVGNVVNEYLKRNKSKKNKDQILIKILPVLAIMAVFSIISSIIVAGNINKRKEIDILKEYTNDPVNVAAQEEYRALVSEATTLNAKIKATDAVKEAIKSYPIATSKLNSIIASCGIGIVKVNIISYSAVSGALSFTTEGKNAETINEFVKALSDTGIFYGVTYSGYTLIEGSTNYNVNVSCTLAPEAGRE